MTKARDLANLAGSATAVATNEQVGAITVEDVMDSK